MRCFVAIELPETLRAKLADVQARLRHLDRMVRWTRPEQIHLTLRFLADAEENRADELCAAVRRTAAGVAAFDLEVMGVGCFPAHGPPRVLWAGLSGPPAGLLAAHRALEEAFASMGHPPEGRPYRPHLTLGRTRERCPAHAIRSAIESLASFRAGAFRAGELVLFRSILDEGGAVHVPLVRAPLRVDDGPDEGPAASQRPPASR